MLHLRQGKFLLSLKINMLIFPKVVGNKFNQFTDLIEQIESNEKAQGHVHAFDENAVGADAVAQKSKEC